MPVLDSEFFPSGSGGSSVKPYVAGMTAKFGDSIRSAVDYQPYIRYSTSPELFTVSADPSTLQSHFMIDDPASEIGELKSQPDSHSSLFSTVAKRGQLWVRTGSYYPFSSLTRPVPARLKIYYDYWPNATDIASTGLTGTISHMVGDGNGNWLAVNGTGGLFKSVNDGITWTTLARTASASAKVACNGTGRWWYITNTGTVFVSDNFGTSWTQQQTPFAGQAAVFAFMCGKLVYVSINTVQVGGTAGGLNSFSRWLPDTNSTSQTWASWQFDYAVSAGHFASGITAAFHTAVTNGTDTIWFSCTANNNYAGIFAYNVLTNTWYVNSIGAANRVIGMAYDDATGYAFMYTVYYINSSNAPSHYESSYTKTAVSASVVASPIVEPANMTAVVNVNYGSCYARRNGSSLVFVHRQDGYGVSVGFKLQGMTQSSSRFPAVSSISLSSMNPSRGLAHAGDTSIFYGGGYLFRSVPVVGVAGIVSDAAGEVKYMRIQ